MIGRAGLSAGQPPNAPSRMHSSPGRLLFAAPRPFTVCLFCTLQNCGSCCARSRNVTRWHLKGSEPKSKNTLLRRRRCVGDEDIKGSHALASDGNRTPACVAAAPRPASAGHRGRAQACVASPSLVPRQGGSHSAAAARAGLWASRPPSGAPAPGPLSVGEQCHQPSCQARLFGGPAATAPANPTPGGPHDSAAERERGHGQTVRHL